MNRIGKQLLEDRKRESKSNSRRENDLLSLLVHANTSTDIPEHQKMSDEDVIARMSSLNQTLHTLTIYSRNTDFYRCWTRDYKVSLGQIVWWMDLDFV